jgi:hypothetical protein
VGSACSRNSAAGWRNAQRTLAKEHVLRPGRISRVHLLGLRTKWHSILPSNGYRLISISRGVCMFPNFCSSAKAAPGRLSEGARASAGRVSRVHLFSKCLCFHWILRSKSYRMAPISRGVRNSEAKSNPAAGRPGLPPEGVWELGRSGCASRHLEFDSSFESPQCVESESVAISWGLHVP